MRPRDRLIIPLAAVLTVGLFALLAAFLIRDDDTTLHALLAWIGLELVVAGYVFGATIIRRGEASE